MSAIYNCAEYKSLHHKFCYLLSSTTIQNTSDRFERLHQLTIDQASRIHAFEATVIDLLKDYEQEHRKDRDLAMVFLSKAQDRWQDVISYEDDDDQQSLEIINKDAINLLGRCLTLLPQSWSQWTDMSVLVEAFCLRATFFYLTCNYKASFSDCKHATEALFNIGEPKTVCAHYHTQPAQLAKLVALELTLIAQLHCQGNEFQLLVDSLHLASDINIDHIFASDTSNLSRLTRLEAQLITASAKSLLRALFKLAAIFIGKGNAQAGNMEKEAPNFSINPSLRLESSEHGGRFYVVGEHLSKGECILKEQPRSLVMFHEHLNKYCNNCHKLLVTWWPCFGCTEAFYCRAQCARQAYDNFHQFECGIFGFLLGRDNFYSLPHVYRFYTQFGVDCATRVELSQPEQYPVQEFVDNYLRNKSMQYGTINRMDNQEKELLCRALFSLLSHRDKRDVSREVCHTLLAFALVFILKHRGQLRCWWSEAEPKEEEVNADENDGTMSLYRLSQLAECIGTAMMRTSTNGFCWSIASPSTGDNSLTGSELIRVASCLCLVSSFINHSCSPNVTWKINGNGIEMKTLRNIEPGEPLTICYGPRHSIPFDMRQHRLKEDYLFFCRCELCLVDSACLELKALRCLVSDDCPGPLIVNQYRSCLTCGRQPTSESSKHLKSLLVAKNQAAKEFLKSITPLLTKAHRKTLFNVSWSMSCLPHIQRRPNKKQPMQHLVNNYPHLFNDAIGEIEVMNYNKLLYEPDRKPMHLVVNAFVVDRFKLQAELSPKTLDKIMKHYTQYASLAYGRSFKHFSMLADLFYLNQRHKRDQCSLALMSALASCLEAFTPTETDATYKGDILRLDYIAIYLTHLATKKKMFLVNYYGDRLAEATTFRTTVQAVNTKLLAILRYDLNERGNFFPETHAHQQLSPKRRLNFSPPDFDQLSTSERFFVRMYQHCQSRLDLLRSGSTF